MSTNLDSLKGNPKYGLYKVTAKSFKPDAQLGTRGPLIPEKQNHGASQLEQVVNLRPITNVSGNILTSGSFIDIPINGSIPCNYIDGLILQTTYSNTTGSSCRLAPSPLQINYIQILTPEGVPAQQTYGQYIYQTLISILDNESLRPMAPALNMDYYYGPGAPFPMVVLQLIGVPSLKISLLKPPSSCLPSLVRTGHSVFISQQLQWNLDQLQLSQMLNF